MGWALFFPVDCTTAAARHLASALNFATLALFFQSSRNIFFFQKYNNLILIIPFTHAPFPFPRDFFKSSTA